MASDGTTTTRSVTVRVPAKVNLHLGVHPKRTVGGYHLVDSIMAPVGAYDVVTVSDSPVPSIGIDPPIARAPTESTAWHSALALAAALGVDPHVSIEITRGIPSRGGLGSASADVAGVIGACCELWGADIAGAQARALAHRAGADVAFFLNPTPSYLSGIGNQLVETYPSPDVAVALVMPSAGVDTTAAYVEFDRAPTNPATPDAMRWALANRDVAAIAANLYNNLADASIRLLGEIAFVLDWVRECPGVLAAEVTGSGSCVFALCESDGAACAVADAARRDGLWALATRTIGADALTGAVVV